MKTVTSEKYLLPEYMTDIVLVKDLNINFLGLDPSVSSELLAQAAYPHMIGSYGPFSFSGTISYQHVTSHTQATTTADGIFLSIPGAQVIGYVTKVLPPFPKQVSASETLSPSHPEDPNYAIY